MFTIDLLKGHGIAAKSKIENIVVAALTVSVSVIILIVMFGFYLSNGIAMAMDKRQAANYEEKISEFSEAVKMQKAFESEKENICYSLSEVSNSIDRFTQWSPVIIAIVENMPDSMVLTKFELKPRKVKRFMPQKGNPGKMVETGVLINILNVSVCGSPQTNYDEKVRAFSDRLSSSEILKKSRLEEIRISQEVDKKHGKDVVVYEMDCIFGPKL
jgi:hypothetical protein